MAEPPSKRRRIAEPEDFTYRLDDETDDYVPYVPIKQQKQQRLQMLTSREPQAAVRAPEPVVENEKEDEERDEERRRERTRQERTLLVEAQEVQAQKAFDGNQI